MFDPIETAVNEWMPNWKGKEWKGSLGKTVENVDLFQRLDSLLEQRSVRTNVVTPYNTLFGVIMRDSPMYQPMLGSKEMNKPIYLLNRAQ